jgi:hypothetical protein
LSGFAAFGFNAVSVIRGRKAAFGSTSLTFATTGTMGDQLRWIGTIAPTFTAGQAGSYSVTTFVFGYNAGTDTITLAPGSAALPTGITFNGTAFVASGSQTVSTTSGVQLRVTRGGVSVDSSTFSVVSSGTPTGEWIGKTARYVRAGASGSGSGLDWTNAYTSLPSTLTRDYVYYVADGSYGSYTCDDALSGTQKIYIVKATEADHGTNTGWNSTYGDGQATFGTIFINRGYMYISGQTRTESNTWAAPSGYGFRVTGSIESNSLNGDSAANSIIEYVDIGATWAENPSSSTIATYGRPIYMVFNQTNVTFRRCDIHNGKGALVYAHGSNGLVFEYCNFSHGWGKEAIAGPNVGFSNMVVRYCRFWNSTQKDPGDPTSGITAEIGSFQGSTPTGNLVYGNVFLNTAISGRNAVIMFGDPESASNCKVFNNTFVDIADSTSYAVIYMHSGSGNEARNNLFYNCATTSIAANSQSNNVVATVNPFVNYAGKDFRLTASNQARNVGTNLGAPYNIDPLGNTRGADGTWDVGAYEYT